MANILYLSCQKGREPPPPIPFYLLSFILPSLLHSFLAFFFRFFFFFLSFFMTSKAVTVKFCQSDIASSDWRKQFQRSFPRAYNSVMATNKQDNSGQREEYKKRDEEGGRDGYWRSGEGDDRMKHLFLVWNLCLQLELFWLFLFLFSFSLSVLFYFLFLFLFYVLSLLSLFFFTRLVNSQCNKEN